MIDYENRAIAGLLLPLLNLVRIPKPIKGLTGMIVHGPCHKLFAIIVVTIDSAHNGHQFYLYCEDIPIVNTAQLPIRKRI